MDQFVACYKWADDNGVDVINCSTVVLPVQSSNIVTAANEAPNKIQMRPMLIFLGKCSDDNFGEVFGIEYEGVTSQEILDSSEILITQVAAGMQAEKKQKGPKQAGIK